MFWTSSLRNTATISCRDGKMSTSLAKFYRMRGSLSSGEYPLLSTGQDLTDYLISSATVKYAKGLQTKLTVPAFTGWDTVNIVELDGQYYWASLSKESTTYNGSVEFTLDYMGPTSLFKTGASVKGNWHKIPANTFDYLRAEITNDFLSESETWRPKDIEIEKVFKLGTIEHIGLWYQIIGYDSSNNIKKYGGFMPYSIDEHRFDYSHVFMKAGSASVQYVYPNLYDLIQNINRYTGLDATKILDFSVSARCPYKFNKADQTGASITGYLQLYYNNTMTEPEQRYYASGSPATYYYLYDITNYPYDQMDQTITITLNEEKRAIGSLGIRDWNNNIIMTMPNRETHTINFRTVGDLNGIYTVIRTPTQLITVPEGHLPYLSNSWEYYKAYQMDTDRQAMENAIKYARNEFETGQMTAMANTAINAVSTGVMGGAIAGAYGGAFMGIASGLAGMTVGMFEQTRALELKEMQARDDFQLSQRKARMEPQTAYNVGYGGIYAELNILSPLRVSLSMPENIAYGYYDDWVDVFGHPAEGVADVAIENGYYQGKLLSDASDRSGMYWDECNRTFMEGFRFIPPGQVTNPHYITYGARRRVTTPYDVFTFYSDIQMLGNSAFFKDTDDNVYDNLLIRSFTSSPDVPQEYYIADSDGSNFGSADIYYIIANTYHHCRKIDTDGMISGVARTYASETPVGLTALIISRDFELQER